MDKKTFSVEVKIRESEAHTGYCRIKGCVKKIHSFHHRLPNTKSNQKKYPLFLQSQFNIAGLCDVHHINHSSTGIDITEREAAAYEEYLKLMERRFDTCTR